MLDSGQGSSMFSEPQLSMSYSSPATSQPQQVPGQATYPPSSQAPQQHTAYPQQPMVSHRRRRANVKNSTLNCRFSVAGHMVASLICFFFATDAYWWIPHNILVAFSSQNDDQWTIPNFSKDSLMHKAFKMQKSIIYSIITITIRWTTRNWVVKCTQENMFLYGSVRLALLLTFNRLCGNIFIFS